MKVTERGVTPGALNVKHERRRPREEDEVAAEHHAALLVTPGQEGEEHLV